MSGIYIGTPAIITNKGVRELVNIDLSEEEQEKFDKSYEVLSEMVKEVESIL